jgi:hypothetical protein
MELAAVVTSQAQQFTAANTDTCPWPMVPVLVAFVLRMRSGPPW